MFQAPDPDSQKRSSTQTGYPDSYSNMNNTFSAGYNDNAQLAADPSQQSYWGRWRSGARGGQDNIARRHNGYAGAMHTRYEPGYHQYNSGGSWSLYPQKNNGVYPSEKYQQAARHNYYSQYGSQEEKSSKNTHLIIALVVFGIVVLVAIAVAVGVVFGLKEKSEERYVNVNLAITNTKNITYDEEYTDPESQKYQALEEELCDKLNTRILEDDVAEKFSYVLNSCEVTDIRKGSLKVFLSFIFDILKSQKDDLEEELKELLHGALSVLEELGQHENRVEVVAVTVVEAVRDRPVQKVTTTTATTSEATPSKVSTVKTVTKATTTKPKTPTAKPETTTERTTAEATLTTMTTKTTTKETTTSLTPTATKSKDPTSPKKKKVPTATMR